VCGFKGIYNLGQLVCFYFSVGTAVHVVKYCILLHMYLENLVFFFQYMLYFMATDNT
jgi:hypothetical protein